MSQSKSRFEFLFFGFVFWAVGFAFFYQITGWEAEFKQDQAAIERGDATPVVLTVTKKWIHPDSGHLSDRGPDSHFAEFGYAENGAASGSEDRLLSFEEWKAIRVGQTFDGFLVNDHLRVVDVDTNPGKAKWFFLTFGFVLGCIPMGITGYRIMAFESTSEI